MKSGVEKASGTLYLISLASLRTLMFELSRRIGFR